MSIQKLSKMVHFTCFLLYELVVDISYLFGFKKDSISKILAWYTIPKNKLKRNLMELNLKLFVKHMEEKLKLYESRA